ncbi:hypothetical protein ACEQPO_09000 [Bacillus sp. SL00103]
MIKRKQTFYMSRGYTGVGVLKEAQSEGKHAMVSIAINTTLLKKR